MHNFKYRRKLDKINNDVKKKKKEKKRIADDTRYTIKTLLIYPSDRPNSIILGNAVALNSDRIPRNETRKPTSLKKRKKASPRLNGSIHTIRADVTIERPPKIEARSRLWTNKLYTNRTPISVPISGTKQPAGNKGDQNRGS